MITKGEYTAYRWGKRNRAKGRDLKVPTCLPSVEHRTAFVLGYLGVPAHAL